MTLAGDAKARATVVELIEATLAKSTVAFRQYAHIDRDGVVRLTARLRDMAAKKKLKLTWVTERSIRSFLRDQVEASLRSTPVPSGMSVPLGEVSAFADPHVTAERLADDLFTLPWTYELLLPLPISWQGTDEHAEVVLDEDYRVVRFTTTDTETLPLHEVDEGDAEFYHREYPTGFATDRMYFAGRASGYIADRDASTAVEEFINAWKGLIGLLLVDLSLIRGIGTLTGAPKPSHAIVVHRMDGSTRRLEPYKWLALDDTALLQRFAETEQLLGDPEQSLRAIAPAFADMRVRTAARWHVDSLHLERGVVEIVQATICLEILFGDEDEAEAVGVTSLLGNRLAYLIGRTPKDRTEALANFKRLYKIRSKIVHAGKAALDDSERDALEELQEYSRRAIHEHISGLR